MRHRTVFFQSDVEVGSRLTLTGGMQYDWANDDNVFVGPDTVIDLAGTQGADASIPRWSPQVGVWYQPNLFTTLRFSAAQILQPLVSGVSGGGFVRERLVPSHLNGFLLNLNETELSESDSYEWGWDQQLLPRTFLRTSTFFRRRDVPFGRTRRVTIRFQIFTFTDPKLFVGDSCGGRAVINHFLSDR